MKFASSLAKRGRLYHNFRGFRRENLFRLATRMGHHSHLVKISFHVPTVHGWMVLSNLDNLTLKRRDDLLVLVFARYVSSDGVVARERSRAEGARHADSLMALANVGS